MLPNQTSAMAYTLKSLDALRTMMSVDVELGLNE